MRDTFFSKQKQSGPFFEGWYFKHRKDDSVLAVIPGTAKRGGDDGEAFIQVIWNNGSKYVRYPAGAFHTDRQTRTVMVGNSVFSPDGVMLDIQEGDFALTGQLEYHPVRGLKRSFYAPGMMGPYALLPFMECSHEVVSLRHDVTGSLQLNGSRLSYDRDAGYIEKDWGRSFPNDWIWLHCNDFIAHPDATLMLSAARIPLLGLKFTGVLGLFDDGRCQIRLATYYGAKCTELSATPDKVRISIRQGVYLLQAVVTVTAGYRLMAPSEGVMSRVMTETTDCIMHGALWRGDSLIWADTGRNTGFECVGDINTLRT